MVPLCHHCWACWCWVNNRVFLFLLHSNSVQLTPTFSLFWLKNNKHSKSGCNMDINGSFIDVLWVTSEIICIYWVQRMPQTTAPQAWRCWPLWHFSGSSLPQYEGILIWNKKAKQLHECIWSCVASFSSKISLRLPDKVYQCLFSFCWYILIWPNWPRSPCCHSVSKTGASFWPVTIFSWCK